MSSLTLALRAYQSALDRFDDAVVQLLGINRTDLRLLDLLSIDQPMSAGELARAAGLSSGAITFAIDRLERAGFVVRRRDHDDRRKVLIEIEPAAGEQLIGLHWPLVRAMREAVAAFTPDELSAIERFLCLGAELYTRHAGQLCAEEETAASTE